MGSASVTACSLQVVGKRFSNAAGSGTLEGPPAAVWLLVRADKVSGLGRRLWLEQLGQVTEQDSAASV